MICPVCSISSNDKSSCPQCGSDLGVHQMLNNLRKQPPSTEPLVNAVLSKTQLDVPSVENDRINQFSGQNFRQQQMAAFPWLWIVISSQVSLIVVVAAFVFLTQSARNANSQQLFGFADKNQEQTQMAMSLLKDSIVLIADQQRELSELKRQAAIESSNNSTTTQEAAITSR